MRPIANTALSLANATPLKPYLVVDVGGSEDCTCRLYEMGCVTGAVVMLERRGDPAILRVGHTKLALSLECLAHVSVEPWVTEKA